MAPKYEVAGSGPGRRESGGSARCACKEIAERHDGHSKRCFCDLWLFDSFSEEEFDVLRTIGRQKVFAKGQTVFHQGAPADAVFLVKTGRVKLVKYFEDGAEVILDFRTSGDLFGDCDFRKPWPRPSGNSGRVPVWM